MILKCRLIHSQFRRINKVYPLTHTGHVCAQTNTQYLYVKFNAFHLKYAKKSSGQNILATCAFHSVPNLKLVTFLFKQKVIFNLSYKEKNIFISPSLQPANPQKFTCI
jgi:hypothetical protein